MSTTVALFNRPTPTHRGTGGIKIECGARVELALRDENTHPGKGTDPDDLAFVIRRRGHGLPFGRTLHGYYAIQEQKEHIERAHEDYGTLLVYTSHEWPCPCDNCNVDDDGGDP